MDSKKQNNTERIFSRDTFQALKGYLCILVIVHHIHQFNGILSETALNYPLLLLGHWCVILFVFMSGFGLYSSYHKKGRDYILKFPKNRLLTFFLMYLFFVILYTIFEIINKTELTASIFIHTFTYGQTIISFGWYLQLSLLLYLVFFLILVLPVSKYVRSGLFLVFALVFVTVYRIINQPFNLYTPVASFLFGLITAVHIERFKKLLTSYKKYIVLAF